MSGPMSSSELKYLKHKEIDSAKWSRCIENADNSRVYANKWYLNRAAVDWEALVWGDYKFVMPVPIKKKMGLKYVYQPLFCQQLGIFPKPPKKVAVAFYSEIFSRFKYADTQLNSQNNKNKIGGSIYFFARHNLLLSFNKTYEKLAADYSKNTRRNISGAQKNGLSLSPGLSLAEYLTFKMKNLQPGLGKKEIRKLKSILSYGLHKGFCEIKGVYTAQNELCAAACFYRWQNRIVLLNAASNKKGKEVGGMFFLIDNFIRANANKKLWLDFEGSMIEGVARFYRGFGATPETYFQMKLNRLSWPLKWIKR
ncbi:MAG: hypothetical protein J7L95_05940 [Prolixibacteraceae bacterium]|nr:hypothetical protein [Prolixibacteraceae bacterium]